MTKPTAYRPAPGARVLKPDGTPVRAEGEALPATPYFARLVAAGDLVAVPTAPTAKLESKAKTTASERKTA